MIVSNTDTKVNEFNTEFEENKAANSKPANSENDDEVEGKDVSNKLAPCTWKFYQDKKNDEQYKLGYRIQLAFNKPVKNVSWHPKGDYFASVLDDKNSNSAVIMHQLSKQKSVRPFAKMNGIVQQVVFHPSKPILFVAVCIFFYKMLELEFFYKF